MIDLALGIFLRTLRTAGDLVLFHGVLGYSYAEKQMRQAAGILMIFMYLVMPSLNLRIPYAFWFYCVLLIIGTAFTFKRMQAGMVFFVFSVRMLMNYCYQAVLVIYDAVNHVHTWKWDFYVALFYMGTLLALLAVSAWKKRKMEDTFIEEKVYSCFLWVCGLILIVGTIYIIFIISPDFDEKIYGAVSMTRYHALSFAAAGLTIVLYLCLQRQQLLIEQMEMNDRCIREQTQQYRFLHEKQQMLRGFRHDLNGHLTVMKKYAAENDIDNLKNYLTQWSGIQEEIFHISTNHVIGDAIFNHYYAMGKKEGVEIRVLGKFPDRFNITEPDLCTILSNLMSNAYEAAVQCELERSISVEIGRMGDHVILSVTNSVSREPVIENGIMQTTKENKIDHGLGLKHITNTLKKYGGMSVWQYEDNKVSAKITF